MKGEKHHLVPPLQGRLAVMNLHSALSLSFMPHLAKLKSVHLLMPIGVVPNPPPTIPSRIISH